MSLLLGALGFAISWYTWNVRRKLNMDANYKPLCDINDSISCSKAIKSTYSTIFGIPNAVIGIVFYSIIMGLALLELKGFIRWLAIIAVAVSAYLAYVQYMKLRNFCVVCTAIYIINILLI